MFLWVWGAIVTIRNDTERYGTIQNDTERYGTIRNDTERYGTIWNDTERYGTIQKDTEGRTLAKSTKIRKKHPTNISNMTNRLILENETYNFGQGLGTF